MVAALPFTSRLRVLIVSLAADGVAARSGNGSAAAVAPARAAFRKVLRFMILSILAGERGHAWVTSPVLKHSVPCVAPDGLVVSDGASWGIEERGDGLARCGIVR